MLPIDLTSGSTDLHQPLLDGTVCIIRLDLGLVGDYLSLNRDHSGNVIIGLKPEEIVRRYFRSCIP